MEDGVLVVEADRRISYANAIAGTLLGTITGALQGQTLMMALRDFQADQAVELALVSGEPQTTMLHALRTGRTLRLNCRRIVGDEARALVVIRDLTQLAHLERARREMVANVSHELRTPLASVQLLVETLENGTPPDVTRRMFGQIREELAAMTGLVEELSELSQIESGRLALRLSSASLPNIVERAIERLHPQVEQRGLTITTRLAPDLPLTLVDETRIGQVLVNLLNNAIKWTPTGGSIVVSALQATAASDARTARELARVDGACWIKLSVSDTGIGIPAGDIDRVFERFYKVDRARTRERSGTGLGLAIAKHLVEHHGGRIWAESTEGHGSTFSMLLPLA